ncbi:hypothetical protein D0C36_06790 [Mucilaginibacter conchicola]|uniref:Uncharacterized protein n=1 Tax=Mucilaginibacter conchicola TaxID=2303333 RepID=A0A372P0H2_9SPHI|nr:hypothetical protein [Mucilaginibacter conchicola]RFZ95227.1 hypothetical protein D0C36_06790 [Mucilaginibacter conchicola]
MNKVIGAIIFAAICFTLKASAQSFDVPKGYHFDKQTDYHKYEPDIIKAADWLQKTHWGTEPQKTDAVTQFVLKWAQGVPYIVIELKQAVMDVSDANPQLGFIYMAQYCKYAIQHPKNFDTNRASIDALRAVIAKYQAEPTHKHDTQVERLVDIDKANELETWVKTDFSF